MRPRFLPSPRVTLIGYQAENGFAIGFIPHIDRGKIKSSFRWGRRRSFELSKFPNLSARLLVALASIVSTRVNPCIRYQALEDLPTGSFVNRK